MTQPDQALFTTAPPADAELARQILATPAWIHRARRLREEAARRSPARIATHADALEWAHAQLGMTPVHGADEPIPF